MYHGWLPLATRDARACVSEQLVQLIPQPAQTNRESFSYASYTSARTLTDKDYRGTHCPTATSLAQNARNGNPDCFRLRARDSACTFFHSRTDTACFEGSAAEELEARQKGRRQGIRERSIAEQPY